MPLAPAVKGALVLGPIVVAATVAAYQENEQFREFVDATVLKATQLWTNVKNEFDPQEIRSRQERKMHAWGMTPQGSTPRSNNVTISREDLRRSVKKDSTEAVNKGQDSVVTTSSVVKTDVEASEHDAEGLRRRTGQTEGSNVAYNMSSTLLDTANTFVDMDHKNNETSETASQSSVFFEAEEHELGRQSQAPMNRLDQDWDFDERTDPDAFPTHDNDSFYSSILEDDPLLNNPFADSTSSSSPLASSLPHPLRSNPIEAQDFPSPVLSRTHSALTVEGFQDDDDTMSMIAYTDEDSEIVTHHTEEDEGESYENVLTPTSENEEDAMSVSSFTSGWSDVESLASQGSSL